MLNSLNLFAGPLCLNPNTEKESFVWGLVIGAFLLGLLSVLFGLAALVIKLRRTLNPRRILWAKRYGLSIAAFFLLMGLGWLVGTGGTADDYCHTAKTSAQGGFLALIAVVAVFVALVSFLGFIFSFSPKHKNS